MVLARHVVIEVDRGNRALGGARPAVDALVGVDEHLDAGEVLAALGGGHRAELVERETRGKVYGAGGAAARLGLKPGTLQSKMGKLGIARSAFV